MTPTPKNLVVAMNPSASFGAGENVGPAVAVALRAAGHNVTALSAGSFSALRAQTAEALAAGSFAAGHGADALIVVGGDGMVSLGVNLLAGTETPLGIIPSGTGNDVARGLGIPRGDAAAAIHFLLEALEKPPRIIDAVKITRDGMDVLWYAGVLSAGFDAVVNERANLMRWPKGASRYNLAILRELVSLKPRQYRLELDGVVSMPSAVLISVANNTSIGGGMLITPEAKIDDGQLDVFIVAPMTRRSLLQIFPRVFKGTHVTDPRVSIMRAKRVRIESESIVAYADGERVGPLPLEVEVVAGALRVFAPAR